MMRVEGLFHEYEHRNRITVEDLPGSHLVHRRPMTLQLYLVVHYRCDRPKGGDCCGLRQESEVFQDSTSQNESCSTRCKTLLLIVVK